MEYFLETILFTLELYSLSPANLVSIFYPQAGCVTSPDFEDVNTVLLSKRGLENIRRGGNNYSKGVSGLSWFLDLSNRSLL